jgi:hypothetical protein
LTVNRTTVRGIVLWIIAIGAIILGYRLSVEQYLDQHWLARAGCFIVILGIWSGLGGVIEEKLLHRGLTIQKYMAMRRIRLAFGADKEEMEKQLQQTQQQFNDRLAALQNELGISIGVIEASLLIAGTLLWGFGDLIKYL